MNPVDRLLAFCGARRLAVGRTAGSLFLGYQFNRRGNRIDLSADDIESVCNELVELRAKYAELHESFAAVTDELAEVQGRPFAVGVDDDDIDLTVDDECLDDVVDYGGGVWGPRLSVAELYGMDDSEPVVGP